MSAETGAPAKGGEDKRRHRIAVRALIVFASLLLVLSMTANWIQRSLLNNEQVTDTTDQIVADTDVQQQLSIFLVDQLYANVDVQAALEQQLPEPVKAAAAPAAAALQQVATDVAEQALANPEVQQLFAGAISGAHEQFVKLIRDEGTYVSTTGGVVTLQYGSLVANLAGRLGVDPTTITEVQGIVRDFTADLEQRLTEAQTRIETLRTDVSEAQAGELAPELKQNLEALRSDVGELQDKIAGLDKKISGVEDKVPGPLQGKLSGLTDRLAEAEGRLSGLDQLIARVLKGPSQESLDALDGALDRADERVTALLDRQAIQTPGELVVMDSDQLGAVQSLVQALRNLGFVLPLLVLFLYLVALYLAKGWRPRAMIAIGGGILVAALLVLLTKRLIGSEVVSALASSETVEPAIRSVWDILSEGLRERAVFVLLIGLGFVAAGLLGGSGRHSVATRKFLAPYLRDHPAAAYAIVAVLFLLLLTLMPGIDNAGQVIVIVLLAVLAMLGVAMLRRQTAREFS